MLKYCNCLGANPFYGSDQCNKYNWTVLRPPNTNPKYFKRGIGTSTNMKPMPFGTEQIGRVQLSVSANIAANASTVTTAQLTAPTGKTSADFQAGLISDDTNYLPLIDLASDKYTEIEFCIKAIAAGGAVVGDVYEFRVTDRGGGLTTYSVTPTLTVALAGMTLVIADVNQSITNDTITTRQERTLVVNDVGQASAVDVIKLKVEYPPLTVADVNQTNAVDTIKVKVEYPALTINDVIQTNTVDSIVTRQEQTLVIQGVDQGSSSDAINLTIEVAPIDNALTVNDVDQSTGNDTISLTQETYLVVNDTGQVTSNDTINVTQETYLAIIDTGQIQSSDGITTTQEYTLAVQDIVQDSYSDGISLNIDSGPVTVSLAINDVDQSTTNDTIELRQETFIVINDVGQATENDTIKLSVEHRPLSINDVRQSTTNDTIALTQEQRLSISDIIQNNSADAMALCVEYPPLSINDISHTNTVDTIKLITEQILSVNKVNQSCSDDIINTTQEITLLLNDVFQDTENDNINLSIWTASIDYDLIVNDVYQSNTVDEIMLHFYDKLKKPHNQSMTRARDYDVIHPWIIEKKTGVKEIGNYRKLQIEDRTVNRELEQ